MTTTRHIATTLVLVTGLIAALTASAAAAHVEGLSSNVAPQTSISQDASTIPGFGSRLRYERSDAGKSGDQAVLRTASAKSAAGATDLPPPRREKCYMIFGRLTCQPLANSILSTDAG